MLTQTLGRGAWGILFTLLPTRQSSWCPVKALGSLLKALLLISATAGQLIAQTDQSVYTDSLQNGWQNWGWATLNYNNSTPVHGGTYSISVTCGAYEALYLHHNPFDSTPYTNLVFWIHGGASGGQPLQVQATLNQTAQAASVPVPSPPANAWQKVTIPLSALGVANQLNLDGFWIQNTSSGPIGTFYVDDISLIGGTGTPITNTFAAIAVDANLNRHPISPLIYGVAFASTTQLADLNSPLNRSGGNAETRYNWLLNAHNRGADWYFESIDDGSATPAAASDSFVASSKNAGSQPMLTIPMIGWVPKLGPNRGKLASYSLAKYGPQTGNDSQWMPDAGNGIGTNSVTHARWPILTNNPNDADFPTNSLFQQAFVQHNLSRWGFSTNGGVQYYLMDNEHSIWHATHQDVHPVGATMQEIRSNLFDYASVVKALDPNAMVLAPEEWGWSGYFYSGYDQQNSGNHDRINNGGWDYGPWLLNQFYQRATNSHQRLLDYFTLHCYPQGGESGSDVSPSTQLLRNRSTRQLWDTNYVDASWIGQQPTNNILMLIPRMKKWVAAYYPGTKIGITEYNWGAEPNINGATAQADIFGIFGREGLDLATRWTTPDASTPTYKAMKLFRNYDGNKSGFGELSIFAGTLNPDNVSAFAALRSTDSALTLVIINKQLTASATVSCNLANFFAAGTAQVWQLTSANAITRLSDLAFAGNSFSNTVPAQSVSLFVLAPGAPARLRPGALNADNSFDFWLDAQAGQRFIIQSSADFVNWVPVQTNTLATNSIHVMLSPATVPYRFFRAQWIP